MSLVHLTAIFGAFVATPRLHPAGEPATLPLPRRAVLAAAGSELRRVAPSMAEDYGAKIAELLRRTGGVQPQVASAARDWLAMSSAVSVGGATTDFSSAGGYPAPEVIGGVMSAVEPALDALLAACVKRAPALVADEEACLPLARIAAWVPRERWVRPLAEWAGPEGGVPSSLNAEACLRSLSAHLLETWETPAVLHGALDFRGDDRASQVHEPTWPVRGIHVPTRPTRGGHIHVFHHRVAPSPSNRTELNLRDSNTELKPNRVCGFILRVSGAGTSTIYLPIYLYQRYIYISIDRSIHLSALSIYSFHLSICTSNVLFALHLADPRGCASRRVRLCLCAGLDGRRHRKRARRAQPGKIYYVISSFIHSSSSSSSRSSSSILSWPHVSA